MRICYIALGKFLHVDPYLDYFSNRGHDVHFVALTSGPQRPVPTQDVGVNDALFNVCGKVTYLPAMLRARKVVRSLRPDVVHAHYATSAGLSALLCGVHPWLVTAHGSDVTLGVRSVLWRALLRETFRRADCVNPVSEQLRKMVLSLGIPEEKIETLTLGIDTRRFPFVERPVSNFSKTLKLICTRSLEPVYDQATIIRSMAVLKSRGVSFSLTLLGAGRTRPHLERLVGELELTDRVTFYGIVPNARLPELLGEHDIYLSSSLRDGTSLSLLEAMSAGLYPIVSDIVANAEWITHGRNGLLHQTGDSQSLADCIVSLGKSDNQLKDVLLHNRQLVVNKGDRLRNMQHLEEIYLRLIKSRGRVPRDERKRHHFIRTPQVEEVTTAAQVFRVRHGSLRPAEHRYILDVILGEHLGLQYKVEEVPGLPWVEIDCPNASSGRRLLVGANLLLRPKEHWLTAAAMPVVPLKLLDCRSFLPDCRLAAVPILFPSACQPRDIFEQKGTIFLPLDIFGGAFFLLTRYEELVITKRDRHDRFPAEESIVYKGDFLRRPVVDEYAQLLGLALSACFPGVELRRHQSTIRLSHDIDHPYQFFRKSVSHMAYSAGKSLFRHPSLASMWHLAHAGARSGFIGDIAADPFNSYSSLMSAGEALGNPCEFYFMAGQHGRRYEEAYDLDQPALQELLREIHARGHVIGLHASYDSFRSAAALCSERDRLFASAKRAGVPLQAIGGRQHYLRWENPTTWRSWDQAGFAYDATLGFADRVGFRCGTSREYPVFDVVASKKLLLRERPLAAMDVTMTDYMGLTEDEIVEEIRNLWTAVKNVGGVMEILVHNCNPQATWLAKELSGL